MKQDVITEENIQMLNSYQETLKRKINAVKTLEDEIVDLEDDPNIMENILSESTQSEINSKAKLASIIKFVAANTMKNESKESKLEPMYRPNNIVNLPKLEIKKFGGDPTLWPQFIDSYTAAINNSKSLSKVEKFNYLISFLYGEALNAVSGFKLTNDNYDEEMTLLRNRFGNSQKIVAAHMDALLKLWKVRNDDVVGLRKLYDDCEIARTKFKNSRN